MRVNYIIEIENINPIADEPIDKAYVKGIRLSDDGRVFIDITDDPLNAHMFNTVDIASKLSIYNVCKSSFKNCKVSVKELTISIK